MAPPINFAELAADKTNVFTRLMLSAIIFIPIYLLYSMVYNLFFSPLRSIPGPKLWAISPLPKALMQCSGTPHKRMQVLHAKYGDVIRTTPNTVSFLNHAAWKEVCGHRKAVPENLKDPTFFHAIRQGILTADTQNHGRQRRILASGFSAQQMQKQEPLICRYIDLLLERIKEYSTNNKVVDVVEWYNYATFDIIGDLTFGESFGCLESSNYHIWVAMIFKNVRQRMMVGYLRHAYPILEHIISPILTIVAAKAVREHMQLTQTKIAKRLALGSPRPDFMAAMTSADADGKEKMTKDEINANCDILIVAGSETTATTLCGITFLLCTHKDVLSKLHDELLSMFSTEEDITFLSVQKLKYMTAVIDEAMRIYPAAPGSGPRLIHKGGETICGRYLPEGTITDIWQWPMYRSPDNFLLPESFIPERWLGDPRFINDRKDAFNPFSYGPRNCIGKNLAYAEMRLIMARLVWNYDISLADPGDKNWAYNQDMYGLWEKQPLNIRFTSRDKEKELL